jgi:NADP-dependent 3-hydroxy acid dehydrogenase YdfG
MSQKIVLVTGASSGFGRLTAEALAGDHGPPGRPARDVVRVALETSRCGTCRTRAPAIAR